MWKLLLVTATTIHIVAAADFTGKWTGTMETNGNPVRITLTLTQQGMAAGAQQAEVVSGTVVTGEGMKGVQIAKAELHNDELTFEVQDNANRLVKFRLKPSGAALNGEADTGGQISKLMLLRSGNVVIGLGGGVGDRVGSGKGSGSGTGESMNPGVYRVGGGVSAPVVISKKDPEYSEEASRAKFQGTVLLSVEIDPNGDPTNIKVVRSLGLGLDEKAIEALKQWKFKPGQKDGKPV